MEKIIFEISPDFTIEDIHKIREYHYWMTKDLSSEERRRYYKDKDFSRQVDEKNKSIAELVHLQS